MMGTKRGRFALREVFSLYWDPGDLQGSAINPCFSVCEAMALCGWEVPAELEFVPSPLLAWETGDCIYLTEIRELIEKAVVRKGDLRYWALVLDRYVRLLPEDRRY